MPKSKLEFRSAAKATAQLAARHGLYIAPNASAKVTALASELADIRNQITELTKRKEEVAARLLRRVAQEGSPDDEGKVRLQSDTANMVIVETANRHIDGKKLIVLGVKASVIEKATKVTEYKYVSVTPKKEGE